MKHNKVFLLILGLIITAEASFTGLLPVSRGHLFSLLSNKSAITVIWLALFWYFLNYFTIDLFQSFKGYIVLKVSLWYRNLRTEAVIRNFQNTEATNIPQRIQEDIKLSYNSRIEVWCEYLIAGLILVQLFLLNLNEPILVICALVYAIISVLIAIRFNPRLTRAELMSQQAEACFRTSLVSNLTDISLLGPTNITLMKAARLRLEYLLFTKLQLGLVAVLPYIILIPKLLNGSIDLGLLMRHQSTFGLIVINAAILIQMYPKLIQGNASELRVNEVEVK
jgi:ABC-type uncharacterized transport system fused permease/ATPase subunit